MIKRLSMSALLGVGLGTLPAMGTLRSIASSSRSVITVKEIQHEVYILAHDDFSFDEFSKHYLEQFYNNFTFHRFPFERENGFGATEHESISSKHGKRRAAIAEVETRKNIQFNTTRGIDFFTRFGFYFCLSTLFCWHYFELAHNFHYEKKKSFKLFHRCERYRSATKRVYYSFLFSFQ
jgi:c-di-GMP-related signal transduction protein